MTGRVFLSYRRDDAAPYAGRLHDALAERLGPERIFMDIDSIDPGERFDEVIEQTLAQLTTVLVVVGPQWLAVVDQAGRRRLDDPDDVHRLEVERALQRDDIRVIPVLVGGAILPDRAELPEALQPLCDRQAAHLTDERWRYDSGQLIGAIERALGKPAAAARQPEAPLSPRKTQADLAPSRVFGWPPATGLLDPITKDEVRRVEELLDEGEEVLVAESALRVGSGWIVGLLAVTQKRMIWVKKMVRTKEGLYPLADITAAVCGRGDLTLHTTGGTVEFKEMDKKALREMAEVLGELGVSVRNE